jgi:hypothetical protein
MQFFGEASGTPWDAWTRKTMAGAHPAIDGTIPAHTEIGLTLGVGCSACGSRATAGAHGTDTGTYTDSDGDQHTWTRSSSQNFPVNCDGRRAQQP